MFGYKVDDVIRYRLTFGYSVGSSVPKLIVQKSMSSWLSAYRAEFARNARPQISAISRITWSRGACRSNWSTSVCLLATGEYGVALSRFVPSQPQEIQSKRRPQ